MPLNIASPLCAPPPPSIGDAMRWEVGRLRERMLSGAWAEDVERRLRNYLGEIRADLVGRACRSMNLFGRLCDHLAACYDKPPKVWHRDGDLDGFLGRQGAVAKIGLWPMMRAFQRSVIGTREGILRADFNRLDGLHVRRVETWAAIAEARAATPDRPHTLWELRWLPHRQAWAWEILSIADPARPEHRLVLAEGTRAEAGGAGGGLRGVVLGQDITSVELGADLVGDRYPYRWTQGERRGEPYLPAVLYHAQATGKLWDWTAGAEAVDAALDVAVAWSFYLHSLFRAGWPQRYVAGAEVRSTVVKDRNGREVRQAVTDPTSLLELDVTAGAQPLIGQWGPGAEPKTVAESISIFESAASQFDGLDVAHVVRRTSNDAASAASLAIQRDSRIAAQATYGTQQAPGDLELLAKLAAIGNAAGLLSVPEEGYEITYQAIAPSGVELAARREHNTAMVAAGRMSIVDAVADEHGTDREGAIAILKRIRADQAEYGQPSPSPTKPSQVTP